MRTASTDSSVFHPRGPALIVFNHSFASYDMFMFAAVVYSSLGRRVRPLGDRLIFRTPLLKTLAHRLGIVEGSMADGIELYEIQKSW